MTMHPRLDRSGSIPRKFITAEPFLEQGLSLALTLVDALGAAQHPTQGQKQDQTQGGGR
jgi:hypothetical protein